MRSISTAGEYNNIRLSEVLPEGSQNPGCDFSLFKRTKTKNKKQNLAQPFGIEWPTCCSQCQAIVALAD
jgi:hypothetical protein